MKRRDFLKGAALFSLAASRTQLLAQQVVRRPIVAAGGAADSGPELISGLQLWLNANAIAGLSDGDEISTWNDTSGNGRNVTGVVYNVVKPVYRASSGPNSKPCVEMGQAGNNRNGYFTVPDFLTSFTAGNGFVVVQLDQDPVTGGSAATYSSPAFGDWGSGSDPYFPFSGDGNIYETFGRNSRINSISKARSLTLWSLYEIRTASGAWSCHLHGTQLHSTGSNTVGWHTAARIGSCSVVNSKAMHGKIAEIVFYSRVLDDATERKPVLHAYLNTKYGFSLPTS